MHLLKSLLLPWQPLIGSRSSGRYLSSFLFFPPEQKHLNALMLPSLGFTGGMRYSQCWRPTTKGSPKVIRVNTPHYIQLHYGV